MRAAYEDTVPLAGNVSFLSIRQVGRGRRALSRAAGFVVPPQLVQSAWAATSRIQRPRACADASQATGRQQRTPRIPGDASCLSSSPKFCSGNFHPRPKGAFALSASLVSGDALAPSRRARLGAQLRLGDGEMKSGGPARHDLADALKPCSARSTSIADSTRRASRPFASLAMRWGAAGRREPKTRRPPSGVAAGPAWLAGVYGLEVPGSRTTTLPRRCEVGDLGLRPKPTA